MNLKLASLLTILLMPQAVTKSIRASECLLRINSEEQGVVYATFFPKVIFWRFWLVKKPNCHN